MQQNGARFAATLRLLGLGTAGFVVATLGVAPAEEPPGPPRPVGYAESLVEAHDCWTGDAPADLQDVIPRHVVVTVDGAARYAGGRMTDKALEQVFGDVDHGLTVHAFCR